MAFPVVAESPSNFYPRIRYGTVTKTIDMAYPLETIVPGPGGVVERNVSRNGAQETLWMRNEWATNFVMQLLDTHDLARLKTFFDNHGVRGSQFQLWLDRFTGPHFLFGDNVRDHNKELAVITGTETYAAYTGNNSRPRYGLLFASGNTLVHPVAVDSHFTAAEGIITLRVRPDFAGDDGVEHTFVTIASSAATTNILKIRKTNGNSLNIQVIDNGMDTKEKGIAVSWLANTEHEIVARWNAGTLDLWLDGVEATTSSGAGSGEITTLGTSLYIGSDNAGTPALKATGVYNQFGSFQKAYTNALTLMDKPVETRTYYSRAELQETQFLPVRMSASRNLNRLAWTIRQGAE